MKHLPVALAAAALTIGTSLASTISLNALGANPRVRLNDGSLVGNGSLVLAGYFANLGAVEATLRNGTLLDIKAVLADEAQFKRFGDLSAESGSGTGNATFRNVFGADGSISNSIDGVTNAYSPQGSQLFMVPLNAADIASSTQLAIFTASNWVMPLQDGDLTLATANVTGNATDIYRGAFVGAPDSQPVTELRLVVPEPGVVALFGLAGLLGLLRRRR
jgi:hypothetical protein